MIKSVVRSVFILAAALSFWACSEGGAAEPDGGALFARHCASCHGSFGEGDGPVAEALLSVPNLRSLSARAGGEFPRESVMRYIDGRELPAAHGDRLMPVWGDTFTGEDEKEGAEESAAERISAMTDFIEQLQN